MALLTPNQFRTKLRRLTRAHLDAMYIERFEEPPLIEDTKETIIAAIVKYETEKALAALAPTPHEEGTDE